MADSTTPAPRKFPENALRRPADDPTRRMFDATAGGGLVRASVNGYGVVRRLEISPEAFAGRDADLLADLVMSAITEAQRRITDEPADVPPGRVATGSE